MVKERRLAMPEARWHRPPTAIYENNYGYGMGFYQPMIDYIDAKEAGKRVGPPHIPWVIERGLPAFDPARRVHTYDPYQLRRMAEAAQERARADIRRPRDHLAPRSELCLAAQVEAARSLSDRVLTDSIEEIVDRKRHERNLRRAESLIREIELMDFVERAFPWKDHHQVGKNAYRAKSARAIAGQLMTESFRNMQQHDIEEQVRRSAALGCGHAAAANVRTKLIDLSEDYERKTITEESKILRPLESLRSDLRCFNIKSAEQFHDSRCSPRLSRLVY